MSSFNYEKALSLEWNGQVFVLTVRKETNLGTDYLYSYDGSTWTKSLDISNSSILTTKSAYNTKWTGSNYAIVGNISTAAGNTILQIWRSSVDKKGYIEIVKTMPWHVRWTSEYMDLSKSSRVFLDDNGILYLYDKAKIVWQSFNE